MQRFYSALFTGLTGLCLGGCSTPTSPTPAYPQNPAISDAQGRPRDSTTFYFPAALPSVDQVTDKMQYSQTAYCQMALASASANLLFFKAPVLSNYYLGNDTYRFLWLRSFHRPVLLTLTQQAGGATLRTQFLTKSATAPRLEQILFVPPTSSQAETARLQQEFDAKRKAPKVQRELAEHNRPADQLPQLETIYSITPRQWQQIEQLLATSSFQQLPPCELSTVMDGAYWVFESHQASGYHMVFRHSPNKQDDFRKACEYLLDLSSARKEKRY